PHTVRLHGVHVISPSTPPPALPIALPGKRALLRRAAPPVGLSGGPGCGRERLAPGRLVQLNWIDDAVDLDAEHRDQAEEEEEREQDEEEAECLAIGVDAAVDREVERKHEGDELEKNARDDRPGQDVAPLLGAVRNH